MESGAVRARVQGSRPAPYVVSIRLKAFSENDWARADPALASRAVFLTKRLAGEMPTDIEEAFTDCRLSLFPATAGGLEGQKLRITSSPDQRSGDGESPTGRRIRPGRGTSLEQPGPRPSR